jgi:hypothetical protein
MRFIAVERLDRSGCHESAGAIDGKAKPIPFTHIDKPGKKDQRGRTRAHLRDMSQFGIPWRNRHTGEACLNDHGVAIG